jgi:ankyrin repeat protein
MAEKKIPQVPLINHFNNPNSQNKSPKISDPAEFFDVDRSPSLVDLLSIVACSGYAEELAPCLALKRSFNDELLFKNATARAQHGPTRKTRLMYACQLPNDSGLQRVHELLSLDWRINQQDSNGKTALHYAILAKNPLCVERLLEGPPRSVHKYAPGPEKANLDLHDKLRGFDALMTASSMENVEIINLLLDAGANIEAKATIVPCVTPLFIAGLNYCPDSFRALLNRGADPNTLDDIERPMITRLSSQEKVGIQATGYEIIRTLFERPPKDTKRKACRVNVRDPFNGKTALCYLCERLDVKEILRNEEVDVNIPDFAMKYPLHYLCTAPSLNVITALSKGADINAVDEDGYTPAMVCLIIPNPNYSVFLDLLNCGTDSWNWLLPANMALRNFEGKTALHFASQKGLISLVKAMHARNPNHLELADNSGKTALILAAENGKLKCVKGLIELGANVHHATLTSTTALHGAVDAGHLTVIDALLAAGANVDAGDRQLETPLMWAAGNNNCTDALKHLIQRGAKLEATDRLGRTALHIACAHNHHLAAQALIDAGANIIARNALGRTPLLVAAAHHDVRSIKLIFEGDTRHNAAKGTTIIDVDAVDGSGRTALNYAAEGGSVAIVSYLLDRGSDPNIIDLDHENAFTRAVTGNHLIAATLIMDKMREKTKAAEERTRSK